MKLNKYFLIGAMGLGLFACSDDLDGNGQDNGNKVQEGTTYAAFTIKVGGGTSSRAIQPEQGEEDYEGNEMDYNDVTIIITTADDDKIQHILTKTDKQENNGEEKYITKTTAGKKKVYAYLNQSVTATKGDVWTGGNTDVLNKAADELGTYAGTEGQGTPFAMSSVEVAELNVQDEVTENTVLTTKANNVAVTVERVVAKVTVELAENFETGNDNNFNLLSLTATIGNPDNLKFENSALSTTTTGSYRMQYNENGDRKTPYFAYPETEIDWTNVNFYTDVYQKLLKNDEQTIKGTDVTNNTARFYCLENTHVAGNYMTYNTTFVRLVATMTPKNAVSLSNLSYADGVLSGTSPSSNESTTSETFYEITAASGNGNASVIGKYVTATALAGLYETVVPNGNDEDGAKADAVVDALNKEGFSFVKYTDGKGYYHIWVNDKSGEEESASEAPVFRNDWYALNITKITLPGDPKDGFEPGPIHPDTHLAVTLNIKKWNKVPHNITLGE